MDSILLRLLDDPNYVECITLKSENISQSKVIAIEEAIVLARTHKPFLIVPGEKVIALEKSLPAMPLSKLNKAVPYAIEEQLVEPIDDYHLVINHVEENGNVYLLVTPRTEIEKWLAPFRHQLIFEAMLPDYLLLPYEADCWHVVFEKNVLIRLNAYKGLSCDYENWQQMLILLWQSLSENERPTQLIFHHYSENTTSLDKNELLTLPITIEEKNETNTLLNNINSLQSRAILSSNLLQGDFAQKHHLSPIKKMLIWAGSLFAIAIVMSLISSLIQLGILKHQDTRLQNQIIALYKQIYPQATSVVAPQIRITETLKDLQTNQTGSGYLGLLALTGQVLKQLPALKILSLHYEDNQLILQLQANNFGTLALALNQLNQNGKLIAKQDQGATKNNQVVARFTIKENDL